MLRKESMKLLDSQIKSLAHTRALVLLGESEEDVTEYINLMGEKWGNHYSSMSEGQLLLETVKEMLEGLEKMNKED